MACPAKAGRAGSDHVVRPEEVEALAQPGPRALAGQELALCVGRQIGEAQQATVDEHVDDVLDDTDQVGVEAGEVAAVAGEGGKIGVTGRF